MNKLIVLDCDGVLLDYKTYYGKEYERFFGKKISISQLNSFHADNYYGITWEEKEHQQNFWNNFQWHNMSPLEGAVEATNILKNKGYKIIVLTSIPASAQDTRHHNLLDLKMPIDATIACGYISKGNPKKEYIEVLNPHYFVDDLASNFKGLKGNTKNILIEGLYHDCPNKEVLPHVKIHKKFNSLRDFAQEI